MKPEPNFQTVLTFDELIAWATAVRDGEWTWTRNSRCKYVTLHIDTRHGAHSIADRNGTGITRGAMLQQFGASDAA